MNSLLDGNMPTIDEIKRHRLMLLVIIVDRKRSQLVTEVLQENRIWFQFTCFARGTVRSEKLEMFGLGSPEKVVELCLILEDRSKQLLDVLRQKMTLDKSGMGIAFTLSLSGISNPLVSMINKEMQEEFKVILDELNKTKNDIEKEVDNMGEGLTHDLILAVINQGFSDDLMHVAKAAGANGGTVLHARRVGTEDSVKFFGISIQGEKEVVAIVATHDTKQEIMKAIYKECGVNTEAKGMVLSLPIDSVVGLEKGSLPERIEN